MTLYRRLLHWVNRWSASKLTPPGALTVAEAIQEARAATQQPTITRTRRRLRRSDWDSWAAEQERLTSTGKPPGIVSQELAAELDKKEQQHNANV